MLGQSPGMQRSRPVSARGLSPVFLVACLALAGFLLFSPSLVSNAAATTVAPTNVQQSQGNGCVSFITATCVSATSTGQADMAILAEPSCLGNDDCVGGVTPEAYVTFDGSPVQSGASFYAVQGTTLQLTIDAKVAGYLFAQSTTTQEGLVTGVAAIALEYELTTPGGVVWLEGVLGGGPVTSGTVSFTPPCANPTGVCPFTTTWPADYTGTYYLGGGFAVGAAAQYNADGNGEAIACFSPNSVACYNGDSNSYGLDVSSFTLASQLQISPSNTVQKGEVLTLTGSGYNPNGKYTYCFAESFPTQACIGPSKPLPIDANGNIESATTVTATQLPSVWDYEFLVQGGSAPITTSVQFETQPFYVISSSNQIDMAPLGSVVTLEGSSFKPNTLYFACLTSPSGCVSKSQIVSTDSTGKILPFEGVSSNSNSEFTVSSPSVTGVILYPDDLLHPSGIIDSASLSVTTPALTLSQNNGIVGTVVQVSGSGFAGNTAYSLCLTSSVLGSAEGNSGSTCSSAPVKFTTGDGGQISNPISFTVSNPATSGVIAQYTSTASSVSTTYYDTAAAFTVNPSVTLPLTLTPQEAGTPILTFSLGGSGCQVLPNTIQSDGVPHDVSVTPGCPLSVTGPTGANTRALFMATGSSKLPINVCDSLNCPAQSLRYYYQVRNTYQAAPISPTSWDQSYSLAVAGKLQGSSATICIIYTIPVGGIAGCPGWSDYGTTVSYQASAGSWTAVPPSSFPVTTIGSHTRWTTSQRPPQQCRSR